MVLIPTGVVRRLSSSLGLELEADPKFSLAGHRKTPPSILASLDHGSL